MQYYLKYNRKSELDLGGCLADVVLGQRAAILVVASFLPVVPEYGTEHEGFRMAPSQRALRV
jgi:hypothetical protein